MALKDWIIVGLAIALLTALGTGWVYKGRYDAVSLALDNQNEAVKRRNDEARTKLLAMTRERDDAQLAVNAMKSDIETMKKEFQDAMDKDRPAGAPAPVVRVRVVQASCDAGGSGGAPTSGFAGEGQGRDSAAGTSVRLLPEGNSRRLDAALNDVELLSRDFNTARRERDLCYAAVGKK